MILMNDFRSEPLEIRQAMLEGANRVLESGWYVLGDEGVAFEKRWAAVCGVRHGVGVGNGMDAIEISLRALDIGIGDEVITTPMTAFATVLAILRSGATPVLADIDPDTALLSLESVGHCLSSRTKAVVLVHLYGQVRSMGAWQTFCGQHGIALVEDCAQAHMATWHGQAAGSYGAAGAFSFYPTKNLGAAGDAGMVVTNDADLAERARQLRNYGQSERYHHPVLGLNSRLDEIHAAMLSARMKWLPEFTDRRRLVAEAYRHGFQNSKIRQLAPPEETAAHVYHLYVITCTNRQALQMHLKEHHIQSLIHYPVPLHLQAACLDIKRVATGLREAELHGMGCLSLPCHPQMSSNDVDHVIAAINSFKAN